MTKSPSLALRSWVSLVAEHLQPSTVHWWAGTHPEREQVAAALAERRRSQPLEPDLGRDPVLIATHRRVDAGPTNVWVSCDDAQARVWPLFRGAMHGRTMYVVPYVVGAPRSAFAQVSVQITDSLDVVFGIDAMTRSGSVALDCLAGSQDFGKVLHSIGRPTEGTRLIVHFPETIETWSIGTGLLGTTLHSGGAEGLRLAASRAEGEGWLAEHMSLFALARPNGESLFFAVASADADGIAELGDFAESDGWKLTKLGGENAWLRPDPSGQLRAIDPGARAWEPAEGVPLSALLFCGRQTRSTPLVFEARSWRHGVYIGATLMREVEGATWATYDPMSMLARCGYNMGDYFAHWLAVGRRLHNPPKIFHVNWFRCDGIGKRLWPGGVDNLRVLKWIANRVDDSVSARASPVGLTPEPGTMDLEGLDMSPERLEQALSCNHGALLREAETARKFLSKFGDVLPAPLLAEHRRLVRRLQESLH